jgi:putative ABC transport system ATP-binding protein
MTTIDYVRIPAKLLEMLAAIVGCKLTVEAASQAVGVPHTDDWPSALAHSCRRAGLKGAVFTVTTADELKRLATLGTPAVTRFGESWLLVLGTGRLLQASVIDPLGEHHQSMTIVGLLDWLEQHGSRLPMRWVAVEARMMLASTEHAPNPMRRLVRTVRLERQYISIALVFGAAMAATSLAVPIAAQALVNTVAKSLLIQPLIMLGLLLLVALIAVGILQVMQIVVAEKIHRRIWVRTTTDWIRRLPRTSRSNRQAHSNTELANRFFDVVLLQKDVVSLVLDGTALVLTTGASLLLLAFYHPWLLAFDMVLIAGIALVVTSGWGAGPRAVHESNCKYDLFAWMDDVAAGRLIFADARGRAFADARGEMLLRRWLDGRASYFKSILRQIGTGVGLQVISTVALLCLGGWLVIQRQLTLGQLVAASVLVSTIGAGLSRLGRQLDPIYEAAAAVATFAKTLDAKLEVEGGVVLPQTERPMAVELRDRTNDDAVLVALAPGERLGLRGGTNSHSRVLDLLYGLFDSNNAHTIGARLDGLETQVLDCEILRAQVGLVRGSELVWATIRDNLELGQRGDDNELLELLELVGLRDRVLQLPNGLDTMLFHDLDGGLLDESEARRIVLVRVLLAHPRLLLINRGLDNIGLDAKQRQRFYDWLFDHRRPWTLIVVTHSAELLDRCDHVLEIPNC